MAIFISYAREDRVFASELSAKLEDAGIDHWIDTRSIKPGQDWKRAISLGLTSASHIVLPISGNVETAFGNSSVFSLTTD